MQVRAQQGDTVDAVVFRHFGRTAGLVESVLKLNPGLAAHGPVLPHGLLLTLPDRAPAAIKTNTVKLWD